MATADDPADAPTAPGTKPSAFDLVLRELAAAPAPPPAPWEMLEQQRFRILEKLGGGGGGQVYKAYDVQLDRHVALKFLNAVGDTPTAALVKEARTQARVQHPHVCQVFEVVETVGQPFLVMQLIEGPTLTVAAAVLSLAEKVRILRQVSEAVAAAHQLGIVHRDIKPNNIMLQRATESDAWHPFVMDFGLARELDKAVTHGVVGTPHYMAPEQARGDASAVGVGCDVWALGATLFVLLEGRPPFAGDSMLPILQNVMHEEPAPFAAHVPRDLAAIVMRCLEKEPSHRYTSARSLADDLARYERGESVLARPPSRTRRWFAKARRAQGVLVLVLGGGALGIAALASRARHVDPAWRADVCEREPSFEENAAGVKISPDGTMQVYASNRDGKWRIYLEPVNGGAARIVSGDRDASSATWAPDGKSIYFTNDSDDVSTIVNVGLAVDSPPVDVLHAEEIAACGDRLFYLQRGNDAGGSGDRIATRPTSGGAETELVRAGPQSLYEVACDAAGQRVAYTRLTAERRWRIAWLSLADGIEHVLPSPGAASSAPTFHPDGKTILSQVLTGTRHTIWEQSLDGATIVRELTSGGHDVSPAVSPDGRRLYYNVDLAGGAISESGDTDKPPRRIVVGNWQTLQINGGGTELVATRLGPDTSHIATIGLPAGTVRELAPGRLPVFGPDGKQIYFVHPIDAHVVLAMPHDGSQAPSPVARLPHPIRDLDAASDGLHIGFRDGTRQAYRQPYDGSTGTDEGDAQTTMVLPAHEGWQLVFGVDGKWHAIPPGPWPAALPAPLPYVRAQLTADRRGFVGMRAGSVWYYELATGRARRLGSAAEIDAIALAAEGAPLYSIEDVTHTRRMEITNYGDLPRPR